MCRLEKLNAVLAIALFAAIYAFFGRIGLSLDAVNGFAALVWPATGLALAALLLFGTWLWPGLLLGAILVNVWAGAPLLAAFGVALGNTCEALLGAYIMRRFGGYRGSFDRLRHVIALILGATAISTLVSATVGVISISLAGIIHGPTQILRTWFAWWLGDGLGNLVVAPLILTWAAPGRWTRPSPGRMVEAFALTASLVASSYYAFFRPFDADPFEFPYLLFPLLVWAALRFEMRGAT